MEYKVAKLTYTQEPRRSDVRPSSRKVLSSSKPVAMMQESSQPNQCFQWVMRLFEILKGPDSDFELVRQLKEQSSEFLSSDEFADLVHQFGEDGKTFLRLIAKYLERVHSKCCKRLGEASEFVVSVPCVDVPFSAFIILSFFCLTRFPLGVLLLFLVWSPLVRIC